MAEGDIGAVIDSLNFDATTGGYPSIAKITDTIYAIAYGGVGSDGWLCTAKINADGSIDNAVIDTMEFNDTLGVKPSMVHVAGSIYAIAYYGPDADGWICTVKINDDGSIDDAVIDTFEFAPGTTDHPVLIKLAGNVFAIADTGPGFYGFIYTLSITDAGAISDALIDTLKFEAGNCFNPRIIRVNAQVCAIVYEGPDLDGWLCTVPVTDAGGIGDAVIDTLEFDAAYAASPFIIHIAGTVFAIAYQNGTTDGVITTVTIAADGTIADLAIDAYTFTTNTGGTPFVLPISGNVYVIGWTDTNNDLWLSTVTIAPDGTITEALVDTLEIDAVDGQFPVIVHVTENLYAVAYTSTTQLGKILTVDIFTIAPGFQKHLMIMGLD